MFQKLKQKLNPKRQKFWERAVGTYNRELDELRFGYGLTEEEAQLVIKNYVRFKIDRLSSKLFIIMLFFELLAFIFKTNHKVEYDIKNNKNTFKIKEIYKNAYNTEIVYYKDDSSESGFLTANALSGKDSMQIEVFGNEDRILLTARYDNLGKGASGAAVECLNIVLGQEKTKTLEV